MSLRNRAIRLATENPKLRKHLVPLLRKTAAQFSMWGGDSLRPKASVVFLETPKFYCTEKVFRAVVQEMRKRLAGSKYKNTPIHAIKTPASKGKASVAAYQDSEYFASSMGVEGKKIYRGWPVKGFKRAIQKQNNEKPSVLVDYKRIAAIVPVESSEVDAVFAAFRKIQPLISNALTVLQTLDIVENKSDKEPSWFSGAGVVGWNAYYDKGFWLNVDLKGFQAKIDSIKSLPFVEISSTLERWLQESVKKDEQQREKERVKAEKDRRWREYGFGEVSVSKHDDSHGYNEETYTAKPLPEANPDMDTFKEALYAILHVGKDGQTSHQYTVDPDGTMVLKAVYHTR